MAIESTFADPRPIAVEEKTERIVEAGLIRRVDKVRLVLTFFLLALLLSAPPEMLTNAAVAHLAIAINALLAIFARYIVDWDGVWEKGKLPLVGTILMLADVAWLSLFIYGTGGFHSPFEGLLLLAILFGAAFFDGLTLAFLSAIAIVSMVHVYFAVAATQELSTTWQLSGQLIAVVAVAWLAYGLSMVLERERKANESVIRSLSEGALLIDADQTVMMANPQLEKMCNLPREAVVGVRVPGIPHEPAYRRFLDLTADVGRLGPDDPPTTRDIPTGLPGQGLSVTTIPLGRSASRPLGWMVICQDISGTRAMAEMTSAGIAVLSHELRSPLAALRATSEVLSTMADQLDEEQRANFVQTIGKQTDRLLSLVSKLMNLSALERGTYRLQRQPVRVEQLISDVADGIKLRAHESGIRFLTECGSDMPELSGDYDLLQQMLTNLCENALKYTPAGGEVRIAASRVGESVEIAVSDTGSGIPEDKLEAIFEKFSQADAAVGASVAVHGMGLGLYLCRIIAELHGGRIAVESSPGRGSTFRVLLPVEP